ncbi:MAG: SMP-30/gluconolactonase/LRE family protein [Paracoccaceae bacterium]|nr:SMP-30/gluconolactonase/LRE family protein [Paracoccaceae bacterium]
MLYPPPEILEAEVWSAMPAEFRRAGARPAWAQANRSGQDCDSFLEGPSFDRDGNLWVVDIPFGRVFRISPVGDWSLVTEYDGWPNGLKIHRDGRVFIADYANGIMEVDPVSGAVKPRLTHRHSEHFRGCNDLFFAAGGACYFTDQGQSGLHMPNGRVFRWDEATERLDLLLDTGPSPNGLVMNLEEAQLLVAMTRDNAVWRLPVMEDGTVSKAGRFIQLSGGVSGPDGMALDAEGGLWVSDAGHGSVWGFTALGVPRIRVLAPEGLTTTNVAFRPGTRELYITQSDRGEILRATLPVAGKEMFSHG